MYFEHNVIKNAKRLSQTHATNQKSSTNFKKLFITAITIAPSSTHTEHTYLKIRDIRLFSESENTSNQDIECSLAVPSKNFSHISRFYRQRQSFCLWVFNHHLYAITGTFKKSAKSQDSFRFIPKCLYTAPFFWCYFQNLSWLSPSSFSRRYFLLDRK